MYLLEGYKFNKPISTAHTRLSQQFPTCLYQLECKPETLPAVGNYQHRNRVWHLRSGRVRVKVWMLPSCILKTSFRRVGFQDFLLFEWKYRYIHLKDLVMCLQGTEQRIVESGGPSPVLKNGSPSVHLSLTNTDRAPWQAWCHVLGCWTNSIWSLEAWEEWWI